MDTSEECARTELRRRGFAVQDIPRSDTPTADLRVIGRAEDYLIEVKYKKDDRRDGGIAAESLFRRVDSLTSNNTIRGVIRKACEQLRSTDGCAKTFRLLWMQVASDLQWQLAFASFYGVMPLVGCFPNNHITTTCFYFSPNSAFDHREIDAMVLVQGQTLHVCLNEFSDLRDAFRRSDLCAEYEREDPSAIIDPVALETSGRIVRCGSAVSRADRNNVLAELRRQTGVSFRAIPIKRYTFGP